MLQMVVFFVVKKCEFKGLFQQTGYIANCDGMLVNK